MVNGPSTHRSGEIDIAADRSHPLGTFLFKVGIGDFQVGIGGFALLVEPGHAQVPLAYHARGVSLFFEKFGNRQPLRINQWIPPIPEHCFFQAGAPAVAPGEQAVTGGGTDGRSRVSIGKVHTLADQAVDIWGLERTHRLIVCRYGINPHIIGEDENDVWFFRGCRFAPCTERGDEKETAKSGADHFAASGANDRIWNSLQKLCLNAPEVHVNYFANPFVDAACEAWLGPHYQMTAQVNLVRPGGQAQTAHRDYHLGFQSVDKSVQFPGHVHKLSPVLTLQGGIAHCDMPIESGPTKLLPFSQKYLHGYLAYHQDDFKEYFEQNYVQLELNKGDVIFFSPAIFHAAGENKSADIQRLVNLLQVSSAFGRAMESIDRSCAIP